MIFLENQAMKTALNVFHYSNVNLNKKTIVIFVNRLRNTCISPL